KASKARRGEPVDSVPANRVNAPPALLAGTFWKMVVSRAGGRLTTWAGAAGGKSRPSRTRDVARGIGAHLGWVDRTPGPGRGGRSIVRRRGGRSSPWPGRPSTPRPPPSRPPPAQLPTAGW